MNFRVFDKRTKIIFLLIIIFLTVTLSFLITFIATSGTMSLIYLFLSFWFGSATTILFHFLLHKHLPFLQNLNWQTTNTYTFVLLTVTYICLFPIIMILTLSFLLIFSIAIFITILISWFSKGEKKQTEIA